MLAAKPTSDTQSDIYFSDLEGFERIALAVSGGSDSMAMLHLVWQWNARRQFGKCLTILSVDHGLRPEAALECARVASWCEALGVRHVTLKWLGEKPHSGLQAKARQARYDLMTEWCLTHNVPILLTAHTADDQAETVVMRQARTSSLKSLAGIWPTRDWNGIQVLRPLLSARRDELREHLLSQNLGWIDDPSNVDQRFERVRVRELLDGNASAADSALEAQQIIKIVRENASRWISDHVSISEMGLLSFQRVALNLAEADVADEVLVQLMEINCVNHAPELKQRQYLQSWLRDQGGLRRTLGGLVFAKRRGDILIGREQGRISGKSVTIPPSGEVIWDGRFIVKGPAGANVQAAGRFSEIRRRRDIPAFLNGGLPVVCLGKTVLGAPFHGIGSGVAAEFIGLKHMLRTWNYKP